MKTKVTHPLFDALIAEGFVKNDAALAVISGIGSPDISKMRNGKREVTDQLRVVVMRKFKWSLKRLDQLAPPAATEPTQH